MSADSRPSTHGGGLVYALAAYFIWGLLPLYFVWLNGVDPYRLVAWRVLLTIPLCLAALIAMRELGKLRQTFADRRTTTLLFVSASLIGVNWLIYILAVQAGEFYAASLGYYINPLINVLIGTLFLGERLSRLQWAAVAIATSGIAILAAEATNTLYISLSLALTFGIYGLVRKKAHVESLPGLTVEVLLIAPVAIAALLLIPRSSQDFGTDWGISLLLFGAGVVTAVPLLLFATAAKRMTYSALGFVQFMAPTMVFLCGLLVFREELHMAQAICFVLIWIAVALFCADIIRRGRRTPPSARI